MSDFEAEWTRCAPWIEAALARAGGTHNLADVRVLVESCECRFWAGRNAAMVTEVQVWPRTTWFLFWLAGGDLLELRDELRPSGEAYARERGCSRVLIVGRQGWARALPGYETVAWTCAKELSP